MQPEYNSINSALSLIIILTLGITILAVVFHTEREYFHDPEQELRDHRISVYLNILNK